MAQHWKPSCFLFGYQQESYQKRLQEVEASLHTQAQEHSKKIEEMHKEQNKVTMMWQISWTTNIQVFFKKDRGSHPTWNPYHWKMQTQTAIFSETLIGD